MRKNKERSMGSRGPTESAKTQTLYSGGIAVLAVFVVILTLCGATRAEEIVYDPGKRRDPFVPLTGEDLSAAVSSSGVKLEGIIYDPAGRSMAILNGRAYQPGEAVGDASVVKIQKDYVVISVDGEEKILRIREEELA